MLTELLTLIAAFLAGAVASLAAMVLVVGPAVIFDAMPRLRLPSLRRVRRSPLCAAKPEYVARHRRATVLIGG